MKPEFMSFSVRGVAREKLCQYFLPAVRRYSIVFHYCGLDSVPAKPIISSCA